MTSTIERIALFVCALSLGGCFDFGKADPPLPIDCETIDRAEERFPDLCGVDAGIDAGP
jgi:hypothetical protein